MAGKVDGVPGARGQINRTHENEKMSGKDGRCAWLAPGDKAT